jgi:hypothetical protein
MQRALAVTLTLFLLVFMSADALCCPDGCTQHDVTASNVGGPVCPLCAGVVVPARASVLLPIRLDREIPQTTPPETAFLLTDCIDHPPRISR